MKRRSNLRFDGMLAAAAAVTILTLFFGLGSLAFGYDPNEVNKMMLGKLFFAGPFVCCVAFITIFISRRVGEWSVCFAAVVNYVSSVSFMAYECAHDGCIETGSAILRAVQIVLGALCTPQAGLALTIASLVLVSNRRAKLYASNLG